MILPIKYMVDRELICQKNQMQINKYNIHKNRIRIDHDNNVGDKVMLTKYTAYKYETTYKGPF